jgi:hypothetical protein
VTRQPSCNHGDLLIAVGEGRRANLLTRTVVPIAVIVEGRSADRLMRARGAVLPSPKGGVANLIGGATHARRGAGIDVGVPDAVPRGAGAIAEVVDVRVANGLPRPAAPIGIEESGVADVSARARLRKNETGREQQQQNEEWHTAPPSSVVAQSYEER